MTVWCIGVARTKTFAVLAKSVTSELRAFVMLTAEPPGFFQQLLVAAGKAFFAAANQRSIVTRLKSIQNLSDPCPTDSEIWSQFGTCRDQADFE